MFSGMKRALGLITVETKGKYVVVEGLPANVFLDDIYKTWGTSKIQQYMFKRFTRSSVEFHEFFLPDIVYMLETLHKDPKRKHNYRAVEHILELLYQKTWIGNKHREYPSILNYEHLDKFYKKPLPHQKQFHEVYDLRTQQMNLRGFPLASPPGTGKTLSSLMLAECLEADLIVIVSPKNAIERVWGLTLKDEYRNPPEFWSSDSGTAPPEGKRYYVIHYEYLEKMTGFFAKHKYKNTMLIVDESHNFNDDRSQRTQNLIALAASLRGPDGKQHIVPASGTPIKALGSEMIPMLTMLDPLFDKYAAAQFVEIYGRNASRAVDILRSRLDDIMFKVPPTFDNKTITENVQVTFKGAERFMLSNVKQEMSDFIKDRSIYYKTHMQTYIQHYLDGLKWYEGLLEDRDEKAEFRKYREYADMIRKYYDPKTMKTEVVFCNQYELKQIIPRLPKHMQAEFKNARSVYKYVNLKIMGEALGGVLGKLRTLCHVMMVPHSQLDEIVEAALKKTVIFTSFVDVVDAMDLHLRQLGFQPLKVYGATNKNLTPIIERFKNDPDANPLIATFESLSTAVPLTMANTVVLHNAPFREHERQQAVARVDRQGQDSVCKVVNTLLYTNGEANISTRSSDIMEWSRAQIESIMGIKTAPNVSVESLEELDLVPPPTDPVLAVEGYKERPSFCNW